MSESKDVTFYVAITRLVESPSYFSFIGARSDQYVGYNALSRKRGIEVVAEVFDVSSEGVNFLDGFDSGGSREHYPPINKIVDIMNASIDCDVQKELESLVRQQNES